MSDRFWNEARIAQLKRLWGEGLSASQVARVIGGCTRSAVIGKVHRLNLNRSRAHLERVKAAKVVRHTLSIATIPVRSRGRSYTDKGNAHAGEQGPSQKITMTVAPVEGDAYPKVEGLPAAVLALRTDQCRYGYGNPTDKDFHFCQNRRASDASSYCLVHFEATHDLVRRRGSVAWQAARIDWAIQNVNRGTA